MVSRVTLAVVSAFAITLLMVGTGGAAKCQPHCQPDSSNRDGDFSPAMSNKGGDLTGQDRADWVHQYKNSGGTPPPVDTDRDTIPDAQDQCPTVAGPVPTGCPPPPPGGDPAPGPAPGS